MSSAYAARPCARVDAFNPKTSARGMNKNILAALVGLPLFLTHASSAQTEDQCRQVRAAVAQYGYEAAKAHANAMMTPEEVRAASACLNHKSTTTKDHRVARKRHVAR